MNPQATQFVRPVDYSARSCRIEATCFGVVFHSKSLFQSRYYTRSFDKGDTYVEAKAASTKKSGVLDVAACLDEYTVAERLEKSEAWYCSRCKGHKQATKKFDLWKLPEVLIIHLKRFSSNEQPDPYGGGGYGGGYGGYGRRAYGGPRMTKIDAHVDFPLEGLDVSKWVANSAASTDSTDTNAVYDLYAVSNHFGGMGGGHYTAFAKNLITGEWYNLDDSRAERMNASGVVTKAAFVLFYAKRGGVLSQASRNHGQSSRTRRTT
jgi:ubiquitin carboxyl-terminal hydrolase 4/11/15